MVATPDIIWRKLGGNQVSDGRPQFPSGIDNATQCRKSVGLATRTLESSDNHTAVANNVQADNQAADRDTNWCRRKRAKARAREQQRERCNHQCEEKKAKSNVVDLTLCAGGGNQQVTTRGRYPKDNGHPDRPRRKRCASPDIAYGEFCVISCGLRWRSSGLGLSWRFLRRDSPSPCR